MKDAIILGGGPAALSGAIYLGRYKKETLLITDSFGGQAATAGIIENYPGIKSIEGTKLIEEMLEQAKLNETLELVQGEMVTGIEKNGNSFTVKTDKNEYEAKSVLIATGKKPRQLGIEGEDKLIGKGLSYCATCDGPFAKDREIAIIGGGFAATKSALVTTKYAKKITIINRNSDLTSETVTLEKISNDPKIEVIANSEVIGFKTDNGIISAVEIKNGDGKKRLISSQMVFVEIGQIPNTDSFKDFLKLTDKSEIEINKDNQTEIEGIFAAGDVTNVTAKQVIIAAGEGAKAAISVNSYLESN